MGTEKRKTEGESCVTIVGGVTNNTSTTAAAAETQTDTETNSLASSLEIPFVPITVDENNVIGGAREILKAIRPNWNLNVVEYKLFTDGITNKLVGCFYRPVEVTSSQQVSINNARSNHDRNEHDNEDLSGCEVVLVRVYGKKTDLLIDRKAETRNIKLLHNYGFAPTLYANFINGLAYEYIPGTTLSPETIIKPEIWILIAQRMAEMHKVNSGQPREPMLWNKMQKFLDLLPDNFSDPKKHKRIEKTFPPKSKLKEDFTNLFTCLESLNSPVVFSHNDLLLGNVIYTKTENRVTFIDYEYADYNFQAFDIGNHFTEFAGIDEIDYSRYPSKEFQLEWLTVYLKNYLSSCEVDVKDVERLYVQVNQFALASHYLWAVWGLLQAEHSTIEFDFVQFAQTRFNEYLAKKSTFLALQYEH